MLAFLTESTKVHYQLPSEKLVRQCTERGEGVLSSSAALCIQTGTFTGRSPGDKFIVLDSITKDSIHWNGFHQSTDEVNFQALKAGMLQYLSGQPEVWVRDAYVCADTTYRINVRIINEQPAANLFCYNMFLRPGATALSSFNPQWHIVQAPGYEADPAIHCTRSKHFVVISFSHRTILIGGTAYTGEIKKSVFTILNFILPREYGVLPMHCSANLAPAGDVALFFGLSGTGKTTLSTDPHRCLIGDDEHGWAADSVFNFEGGCYAKVIDLCEEKEPAIFSAIHAGTLVENTAFLPDTNEIDFASRAITENTRASYPLSYIHNAVTPSTGGTPRHIIFLTCDAYGVLPPLSKLTVEQAMYHFISGYTARIAGTETGITEPKATFSACFGAPFLPLHPVVYTRLLGEKLEAANPMVWLVNTGWTGGSYGVGKRISLLNTRAMVRAILEDKLTNIPYTLDRIFGLLIPQACPGVNRDVLNPIVAWTDKEAYRRTAHDLAQRFARNFEPYVPLLGKEMAHLLPAEQFF